MNSELVHNINTVILCKLVLYFRLLPMNLNPDDMTNGVLRDRTKIGSSLADVDPMSIDKSVSEPLQIIPLPKKGFK